MTARRTPSREPPAPAIPTPARSALARGAASRIDLTTLRLFAAIAEEASLTRAAQRERMVIGALSRRVKELEHTLGAQLLYRHPRGVALTPAGSALLTHARNVLGTLARIPMEIAEYAQGVTGHVRIHASTAAVTHHLPEELAQFLGRNPQVRVELKERSSTAVIRAVVDRTADIGIVEGRAPLHELETRDYHRDQLVVVVPRGHPLARARGVTFKDACRYDLVGTRDTSSLHALLQRMAAGSGLQLKVRMQLRGFDRICRMVEAGLGIAIIPEGSVRTLIPAMRVRVVPLLEAWAQRRYLLCWRERDALTEAARDLLDHLASCAPAKG